MVHCLTVVGCSEVSSNPCAGVQISTLHTDHVAADRTRYINYIYAMGQMIPPSRVPGFMFHQTERTDDNGTNACFGTVELCYDMNGSLQLCPLHPHLLRGVYVARDFDLLGFKYSVLANVGTAGTQIGRPELQRSLPAQHCCRSEQCAHNDPS